MFMGSSPVPIRKAAPETALSRAEWMGWGALFIPFGLLACLASAMIGADDWWLHGAWCIAGLAVVAPLLFRALRRGFNYILRDHLVMFTIAFALSYLLGASFMTFGAEGEIARALHYYFVDARTALRVDGVNSIGFGIALIVAAASPRAWFGGQAHKLALALRGLPPVMAMVVLSAVGAAAVLNTLDVDLGVREGIVSGTWRAAAMLLIVAILLAAAHKGPHQFVIRMIAVIGAIALSLTGFLLFSKTQILLPLGALVAGLAIRFGAARVLPIGLCMIAGIYFISSNVVTYGRTAIMQQQDVGLSYRWILIKQGLSDAVSDRELADSSPWGRLSYVNAQAAAMDFHDAGQGGDQMRLIPWLFVPRIIYPDKPVITQSGMDFHTRISGRDGSSTGQGIFLSGYYNLGWAGLVFSSVVCGWLLAQTSAISTAILANRAIILMPFVLKGVYMAFRIDGHFISDYIGASLFILYPLIGVFILSAVIGRKSVAA